MKRTETTDLALNLCPFVQGHNSRTVKGTPFNFKFDLCFVVISIVYNLNYNIWSRQTETSSWNVRDGRTGLADKG